MAHLLEKIQNKISTHSVHEEAPVVKERIHEHAEHVDKTRVEEAHERLNVIQTVQPIVDERREGTRTRVEDHGLEIHEHGKEGLDRQTLAELEARRKEIQAGAGVTVDRTESEAHARPEVSVSERTHTVEQVVPVMERDIYKNERVEHEKREVHIHHEKATIEGTRIAPAITVDQWKGQSHGHDLKHGHGLGHSDSHNGLETGAGLGAKHDHSLGHNDSHHGLTSSTGTGIGAGTHSGSHHGLEGKKHDIL